MLPVFSVQEEKTDINSDRHSEHRLKYIGLVFTSNNIGCSIKYQISLTLNPKKGNPHHHYPPWACS